MSSQVPPFIRVTLTCKGRETLVITRQTPESTQVKIETSARVIYCPPAELQSALAAITLPESDTMKGN